MGGEAPSICGVTSLSVAKLPALAARARMAARRALRASADSSIFGAVALPFSSFHTPPRRPGLVHFPCALTHCGALGCEQLAVSRAEPIYFTARKASKCAGERAGECALGGLRGRAADDSGTGAMQVEGIGEENAGAPKGAAGRGSTISLHPLVIINISDHSTRFRALNGGNAKRVLGVLLGKLVPRMRIPVALCRLF